jgi:hypothetical protein
MKTTVNPRQSGLMKQNISLKDKKIRTQINGKFNNILLMKINKNITVERLVK